MNNDFNNDTNDLNNTPQPDTEAPQDPGKYQFDQQPGGSFPAPDQNKYQFDPQPTAYTPYVQPKTDTLGSSAQIMGILAIVLSFVCCPIVGIVLGAIAMSRAKRSRMEMGYETGEAKTGNICGIIGLVWGIVATLLSLLYFVLVFVFALLGAEGMLSIISPLVALL